MGLSLFTTKTATSTAAETDEHGSDHVTSRFTAAGGANSSKPTYQEATGAPVEENSPLGYSVGAITVVFLNLSKMIGTGVFSTRMSSYSSRSSIYDLLLYAMQRN